jgi:hypothetical protein
MAENSWPGYPDDTEWLDPPTWVLRQWEWSATRGANSCSHSVRRHVPSIRLSSIA